MDKPRQVTDNIHDTIYLSNMESQLIATPYFYRLHDVYQSSTVYMTFPSNRTKRYEHSLGTMQIASQMFFSAVANANVSVRKDLMDGLYSYVIQIMDKIVDEEIGEVKYCDNAAVRESMDAIFTNKKRRELIEECISNSMEHGVLVDSALEHYALCFFEDTMNEDAEDSTTQVAVRYMFLYQCVLEAVRIAALFHDVGHPPYSHIIEEVLDELYENCRNDKKTKEFDGKKAKKLIKSLSKFKASDGKTNVALKNRGLNSFLTIDEEYEDKDATSHLHEQIGIGMLELSIESVFPKLLENVYERFQKAEFQVGTTIYYITVIEFALAILLEKSPLFASIHRIIDGPFDADRLDYVVRDSHSSGVDWGTVPYKRIIESAMLTHVDPSNKSTSFVVAYPEKNADDIEDTLITRYKIFVRINFHHRCIKTATLMQQAVRELALDYLRVSEDEEAISNNIVDLWYALGDSLSSQELKIIQWNDSWLITVLYEVLVKLSNKSTRDGFIRNKKRKIKDVERIKNLLEEILLNQKHYTSLLKRRADIVKFLNEILKKADLEKYISVLKAKEQEKSISGMGEEKLKARESLLRFIMMPDEVRARGEFAFLNVILPTDKSVCQILSCALTKEVEKGNIADFYVIENKGRNKKGLPETGTTDKNLYFYDALKKIKAYNRLNILESQIDVLSLTCPELHVYVDICPEKCDLEEIRLDLAEAIADELRKKFFELFPSVQE